MLTRCLLRRYIVTNKNLSLLKTPFQQLSLSLDYEASRPGRFIGNIKTLLFVGIQNPFRLRQIDVMECRTLMVSHLVQKSFPL